jgi:hypothetical protein
VSLLLSTTKQVVLLLLLLLPVNGGGTHECFVVFVDLLASGVEGMYECVALSGVVWLVNLVTCRVVSIESESQLSLSVCAGVGGVRWDLG